MTLLGAQELDVVRCEIDDDEMALVGSPYVINGSRASISTDSPQLGEHTRELLAEAGFSTEAIARFAAEKVII